MRCSLRWWRYEWQHRNTTYNCIHDTVYNWFFLPCSGLVLCRFRCVFSGYDMSGVQYHWYVQIRKGLGWPFFINQFGTFKNAVLSVLFLFRDILHRALLFIALKHHILKLYFSVCVWIHLYKKILLYCPIVAIMVISWYSWLQILINRINVCKAYFPF